MSAKVGRDGGGQGTARRRTGWFAHAAAAPSLRPAPSSGRSTRGRGRPAVPRASWGSGKPRLRGRRGGRKVVGYAGLMFIDEEAHVTTIAVDPAWHGTGSARPPARPGPDRARPRGAPHDPRGAGQQHRGQALYRRFGLAPVGVRKNYYPETGEDALVMWAHDIDTRGVRGAARRDRGGASGSTWTGRRERSRPAPADRQGRGAGRAASGSSASRPPATRRLLPWSTAGATVVSSVVSQPGRPARPLRRRRAGGRRPGPRRAADPGGGRGPGDGRHRTPGPASTPWPPPRARG